MRDVIAWGCVFCALFGLYVLFAGSMSVAELATGLVASLLSLVFAILVVRAGERSLRVRMPLRLLGHVLVSVVGDSVRVGGALLKALRRGGAGQVTVQPFREGGDTPADAGRRGVVVLAASLTPNGFVLHIPGDGRGLVMHRLVPTAPSRDREWPA
jgi:hypothetical protein